MQTFFIGVGILMATNCPASIQALIASSSAKYNVDSRIVAGVINCESGFGSDIEGDYGIGRHGIFDPSIATTSWGIAQLHLPDHPEITKDQAMNEAWSVDYLTHQISIGHGRWWTCWRLIQKDPLLALL